MTTCKKCFSDSCRDDCDVSLLAKAISKEESYEEKITACIPEFNLVLSSKVNAIFGTDLEVAVDGEVKDKESKEFNSFIFGTNESGRTNIHEIKSAVEEEQIYGKSFLFYDSEKNNVYHIKRDLVKKWCDDKNDSIIKRVKYYTVGGFDTKSVLDENGSVTFSEGVGHIINEQGGYIIHPDNMVVFNQNTYFMNSDLLRVDLLLDINKKISETTTRRDYGDTYVFSNRNENEAERKSSTFNLIKKKTTDLENDTVEKIAESLKRGKIDDSRVSILDKKYTDVKQIVPVTKVEDYQFVWEKTDGIISSAFCFPSILSSLGEDSGNISKDALLKNARANFLTPLKTATASSLSKLAIQMFGEEYHVRFKDYDETLTD